MVRAWTVDVVSCLVESTGIDWSNARECTRVYSTVEKQITLVQRRNRLDLIMQARLS